MTYFYRSLVGSFWGPAKTNLSKSQKSPEKWEKWRSLIKIKFKSTTKIEIDIISLTVNFISDYPILIVLQSSLIKYRVHQVLS